MKYKILEDVKKTLENGKTVYRILDLRTGLEGGWIESEENLSQEGSCMVLDDAVVCGNSRVKDSSIIMDNAYLENSIVGENVIIFKNAKLINSEIEEDSKIEGNVILNSATVFGNSRIGGKSEITNCTIYSSDIAGNDLKLVETDFSFSNIRGNGTISQCSNIKNCRINMENSSSSIIQSSYLYSVCALEQVNIKSSRLCTDSGSLVVKNSSLNDCKIEGSIDIIHSNLIKVTSELQQDYISIIKDCKLSAVKLIYGNCLNMCKAYNSILSDCKISYCDIFDSNLKQYTNNSESTIINLDNTSKTN